MTSEFVFFHLTYFNLYIDLQKFTSTQLLVLIFLLFNLLYLQFIESVNM